MNRLLRYTRITIEAIVALLVTAVLVDYSMGTAHIAGWLARIQFVPACLAMSFGIVALWLGITIIFGRIYCSSACPLGALQDLIARMPSFSRKKKPLRMRRDYSQPRTALRYSSLAIFAACLLGPTFIASLIEPYTAYSRIAVYLLKPACGSIENLIADTGEFTGMWIMAIVNVGVISVAGIIISTATLAAIAVMSVRHGRLFCNTLCPVGSALGLVSRYSIFHMDIDTDKCVQCRKCVYVCKAECIHMPDHVVDASRCVVCFNCVDACDSNAITYTSRRKQLSIPMMQRIPPLRAPQGKVSTSGADNASSTEASSPELMDRRKFLTAGIVAAVAPALAKAADAATNHIDPLETGGAPLVPSRYVMPPGTRSRTDFLRHCTGCGLCISHCTSGVLRPATDQYGRRHIMAPFMDFSRAWCYYNCNRCTTLCPTGALHQLTRDEKHRFVNGLARVDAANCISAVEGTHCGACARRCPTGAITMQKVNDQTKHVMPVVDSDKCIGCGACEYICPAAPDKAIVINGNH